ncbi:MAG TPA: RNA polymerase sigma factor [Blastocatellia bacterium]|nr:RNA polymerase sigma factor [Blastocatellia bacterium]
MYPLNVKSEIPIFLLPGEFQEQTDDELVAAARNHDESAFRRLFERHRRLVARSAGRFFRQREMIEEIVQIVFSEAWFSLGSYQGRGERSFAAWLSRIAINTCYDELRRNIRRRENFFSDLSDQDMEFLEEGLRDSRASNNAERVAISRDLTRKLLAKLSPEDQTVLKLLKVEGLTIAEITALTGWSAAKVKMRVHRARGIFQRTQRSLEKSRKV